LLSLTAAAQAADAEVTIDRISEQLQPDAELMHLLTRAGLRPGGRVHVGTDGSNVEVWTDGEHTQIDAIVSDHVFVRR
jgi:DtxR family transcriptional regulator, Mn-dependent transcriptional regulator